MLQELTIRAAILRGFEQAAIASGLDVSCLFEGSCIDRRDLRDPETRISALAASNLLEQASSASQMGDFGLQVAMYQGAPDFGPLQLLLREEASVRAAIQALSANLGLNTDAFEIELIEADDEPVLVQSFLLGQFSNSRQLVELTTARLVQIIRRLLNNTWRPNVVCFSHMSSPLRRRGYALFRCPVQYGHDFTGILMKAADLDTPLNNANSDLRRHAEAYLKTLRADTGTRFDRRTLNIILSLLASGSASADRTAAQLGVTRRTLNRRLSRVGHTYSSLLQSIREEIAKTLLEENRKSLTAISADVGFRNLSSFSSWFRGSFHCAPLEWRRVHQGHGAPRTSMAPSNASL
jgi:AraC-like DNA-binding protein